MPFFILALFELAFGLFIAKILYAIPTIGSMWLIFGFASVFMVMILGLGLFICHGIVEQHGGELTVESRLGYGSTFHVRLPFVPSEAVTYAA